MQTSQGFTRTNSNARLIYSYCSKDKNSEIKASDNSLNKEKAITENDAGILISNKKTIDNEKENVSMSPKANLSDNQKLRSPTKALTKSVNIADKTAFFESSPSKNMKDPALLSVSERKALFEKNKGEALVPKAPFGMAPPVKVETTMKAPTTKIMSDKIAKLNISAPRQAETKPILHKPTESAIEVKSYSKETTEISKPIVLTPKKTTSVNSDSNCPVSPVVPQSRGIAKTMAALLENKSTISQTQIENTIRSERQKEMDMLLNRFHRNKEISQVLPNFFIQNIFFLINSI